MSRYISDQEKISTLEIEENISNNNFDSAYNHIK